MRNDLQSFSDRNDALNCGFILVGRENFASPRDLFGSRSPVLTARRISIFAGRTEGDDVVPGDEIFSLLMTDEAFADLAFGAGSSRAAAVTLDRAGGDPMPEYRWSWRESIDDRVRDHLSRKEQGEHLRHLAEKVKRIVAEHGYVPKRAGEDMRVSIISHSENLFRNAEYAISEFARAMALGATSDRISMSSAVSNAEGIIEAIRNQPLMLESLAESGAEDFARAICSMRSEDERDVREMCAKTTSASGRYEGHSDLPPHDGNTLRIVIGLPTGKREKMSLRDGLNGEDHLYPLDEEMVIEITPKEMVMAIENGAHGDPVRCELSRVRAFHGRKPNAYKNRWGKIVSGEEAAKVKFTKGLPERREIAEEANEIVRVLTAGAQAKKAHADVADRICRLADSMDAVANTFPGMTEDLRDDIRDAIREEAVRQISGSQILEKWALISEEMREARRLAAPEGPGFGT